jgi:hypothetical protein
MKWSIRRWVLAAPLLVTALLFAGLLFLNAWVNFGLPAWINHQPERLKVGYHLAWTWGPGPIHVWGLKVRSQSKLDQWQIEARHARLDLDLHALRERVFHLDDVEASGVSFRFRRRIGDGEVQSEMAPPIRGLENPPRRKPEEIYPKVEPWPITIEQASLKLHEVWVEDYRFVGESLVTGEATIADLIDADVRMAITSGQVTLGTAPVADAVQGTVAARLDTLPRQVPLGRQLFGFLSGQAALEAHIDSLSFLDHYLEQAPWLSLTGAGKLQADLALDEGEFRVGSWLRAETEALSAQLFSYDIRGDGVVLLEASDLGGVPESQLSVRFGHYTIGQTDQPPLVEGDGFSIEATSPDLSLSEPFSTLDILLELPPSEIRNLSLYDTFFPTDIGFGMLDGTGQVHGRITASTFDNVAEGDVWITGDDLRGRLDDLTVTLDMALHARLSEGRIADAVYDFSGSRLELRNVGIVDQSPDKRGPEHDETRSWWATVTVPSGQLQLGRPLRLDATIAMRSADSAPFVRLAAERKDMAGWLERLLLLPDVASTGRVRIGEDSVTLERLEITGGNYEVWLRWFRQRQTNRGSMYARYGKLSVGLGFDNGQRHFQLLNARDWFVSQDGTKATAEEGKEGKESEPKLAEAVPSRAERRKKEKEERQEKRR